MNQMIKRLEAHRSPPPSLLTLIEARLAANRCIGNVQDWERYYYWGMDWRTYDVDETRIYFGYLKPSDRSARPGRFTAIPGGPGVGDAPGKVAMGVFERTNRRLILEACGDNFSAIDYNPPIAIR